MIGLIFLFVVGLVVIFVRLSARLGAAEAQITALLGRMRELEADLRSRSSPPAPAPNAREQTSIVPPSRATAPPPLPAIEAFPRAAKPPALYRPSVEPISAQQKSSVADSPSAAATKDTSPALPSATLEAFMGVKLFAWLGGLALFLGVVFFVKYSFEHNLITPQMRIAIGAMTGLGLIAGGLLMPRPRFTVTAQTLCATGVVILYGVTYAAYAYYHFLNLTPAFAIMAAIAAAAFLLAVRLQAQVVAILGLLAGFLTPLLLSTGQDHPTFLFSYLAFLNVGVIAVALRQRWHYLVTLAAIATAVMQLAWLCAHFSPDKVNVAAIIFLGFEALFLVLFWLSNRDEPGEPWTIGASAVSAAAALAFAWSLLLWPQLGQQPWICLSIALTADAGLVAWPLRRQALQSGPLLGGAVVFLILCVWNFTYLTNDLLKWGLGYFLLFAAFHTALPVVLQRLRPSVTPNYPRWIQVFPALGLILMLWPALHIGASAELWLAVLIVDLAAIYLAARTASPLGVLGALVLTLVALAMWLVQTTVATPDLGGLLAVVAGFATLFCGASVILQKRLSPQLADVSAESPERQTLEHLPSISAVMPFALLISTVLRLHPQDPSTIFSVGVLLVAMILGLARWSRSAVLPPIALICTVMLEYCWRSAIDETVQGWLPLSWYLTFASIIFAFPFLAESRKATRSAPWVTAALAPVLHYPLIVETIRHSWPSFWNSAGGLIPAALALPPLAACFQLRNRLAAEHPARMTVLAWFGGVALLFVTLIFPTQFHHEWLTLSWALEGVALLWLFHRVPHPGLRKVGFILLCVAFVRLALNPAALAYHSRSGIPIWNWYLYTYGIAAACFFVAGRLTAPPRDRLGDLSLPAILHSLGTILLFLFMNIEIADYFSTSPTLRFEFNVDLARDMTYSIAWSLFALALLLIGMHRQVAGIRYAGIGLLVITLAKLFLHDLASLDQLYRIGAFLIVSVVLIGASYLYQRFLSLEEPEPQVGVKK